MPAFKQQITLPVAAAQAFDYLTHDKAFIRLTPPWEKVCVVSKTGGVTDGALQDMRVQLAPGLWTRWLAEHRDYIPGTQFVDVQRTGPFAQWVHTHRVDDAGNETSILTDHITYKLPFDLITGLVGYAVVRQKLDRMFAYRHHLMAIDLSLPPIKHKVLVSGRLPCREALSALLAIKGATLCQYADEQPDVAIMADHDLPGNNLRHTHCIHWSQLPALPADHPIMANRQALGSAWSMQQRLYQAYHAIQLLNLAEQKA